VYLVWRFGTGWNPALVPLAAAYYSVEDLDALFEGLLAMRERIDAHKAAQRGK